MGIAPRRDRRRASTPKFNGLRLVLHRGGIVPRLWLRLEAGGNTPCLQPA